MIYLHLILLFVSVQYVLVSTTILDDKFEVTDINDSIWIVNINSSSMTRSLIDCSLRCLYLDECDAFKYNRGQDGDLCQLGLFNGSYGNNVASPNITVYKKVIPPTTTVSTTTITTTTATTTTSTTPINASTATLAASTSTNIAVTSTLDNTDITLMSTTDMSMSSGTTVENTVISTITTTSSTTTTTTTTTPCINPPKENERNKCKNHATEKVGNKVFLKAEVSSLVDREKAKELCEKDMHCRLPTLENQDEIAKATNVFITHGRAQNSGGFWLDLSNHPSRNCIGDDCFKGGNTLAWSGCVDVDINLFNLVKMNTHHTVNSKTKPSTCTRYTPGDSNGNVSSFPCREQLVAVCMCMC